ncbi:hypothetical protein OOT46_12355 [Aquabacterium sp. A7-Y]|uniref:hypothetical protein n=1 Tax=Aquabacterium sp. A7-Y TaxID=1349605 RepID=UPI00223D0CF9|nr:hypothetical protein [Aquabacterium sp. A7-Y]MCW7538635.1 hypothetical protein [Aquabacterium sp. A7-Y]
MNHQQGLGKNTTQGSANRDPITGTPGAHPVGTGIGAAAGGIAAGAAVGTVAGPVGTAIGAAVGAVAGGLAGKGIAEQIDPTVEDAYWADTYRSRPYVPAGSSYDEYGPAYRYGVESYSRNSGLGWEESEAGLASGWDDARGRSTLSWDQAKHATRDSWQRLSDRIERAIPGDSDRDGH